MKSIYLVRHCDYEDPDKLIPGRLPVPLSEAGVEKAKKLAAFFQDKDVSKIYSSAVHRCQETSEIISGGKIPIQNDQRLLEVFTAYQGFTFKEAIDWRHFYGHRHELGGEGYKEVQKRMVDFFQEAADREEGNVIICSHGDPLYVLYLHLTNRPLIEEDDESSIDLLGLKQLKDYPEKGSIREVVVKSPTDFELKPFITFK